MGNGKTLWSTAYALKYFQEFPNNKIYSNYHIDLPNAIYTPYMYLPYQKLGACLIIADDFYALRNIDGFVGIIVNKSRKKDIIVILTAQYYTMIPKGIRTIANFEVRCKYMKKFDSLVSECTNMNGNTTFQLVNKAVSKIGCIYDTNEEVSVPTEMDIAKEIIRFSRTPKDIELNIEIFSNAYSKRKRMRNLIIKLKSEGYKPK